MRVACWRLVARVEHRVAPHNVGHIRTSCREHVPICGRGGRDQLAHTLRSLRILEEQLTHLSLPHGLPAKHLFQLLALCLAPLSKQSQLSTH